MVRKIVAFTCVVAATASPWTDYLASHNVRTFNYAAACKSMGQTASSMSMSNGKYTIGCNSNHIVIHCGSSKCTSSYTPPASAGDSPPTGSYNKKIGSVGGTSMSRKLAQDILNMHNKMRCAVGSPPVRWNPKLAAQAQREQNKIGAFRHSHSYSLPIHAGENLASGKNVMTAAWMWFTEYTQSTDYAHAGHLTGHYSAMVWKGVSEIGCGMGNKVIRCQYRGYGHNGLPNMGGQYRANVPKFMGSSSALKKCGLTKAEVHSQVMLFRKWGILHPKFGYYEVDTGVIWQQGSVAMIGGMISATVGLFVLGALTWRRRKTRASEQPYLVAEDTSLEEGDGLE